MIYLDTSFAEQHFEYHNSRYDLLHSHVGCYQRSEVNSMPGNISKDSFFDPELSTAATRVCFAVCFADNPLPLWVMLLIGFLPDIPSWTCNGVDET
mmetsp:Transcript_16963/g.31389  ORF Transcript_16963/g.31389 Transcript_16963/m.31389 type:complete len:96 (+) Transcript_16963:3006-3293(+)